MHTDLQIPQHVHASSSIIKCVINYNIFFSCILFSLAILSIMFTSANFKSDKHFYITTKLNYINN